MIYSLFILTCLLPYYFLFSIPSIILSFHLMIIVINCLVLLHFFLRSKQSEHIIQESAKIKSKIDNQKDDIKKVYDKHFKDTKYEEIFDKSIFPLVELLYELTEESLNGIFQSRVNELINKTMQLYIINIKQAVKLKKAKKAGLDIKEDLENVLKQNNVIMKQLKEFVMKLVLLEENSKEFNALIKAFEQNLKTLNILKERSDEN